jgi:hypothetical protein
MSAAAVVPSAAVVAATMAGVSMTAVVAVAAGTINWGEHPVVGVRPPIRASSSEQDLRDVLTDYWAQAVQVVRQCNSACPFRRRRHYLTGETGCCAQHCERGFPRRGSPTWREGGYEMLGRVMASFPRDHLKAVAAEDAQGDMLEGSEDALSH